MSALTSEMVKTRCVCMAEVPTGNGRESLALLGQRQCPSLLILDVPHDFGHSPAQSGSTRISRSFLSPEQSRPRQAWGHKMIASLVKKKSAIKMAIEITTTVRVVLLPTPAVPPLVVMPKWQPTKAMIAPNTGVLIMQAMKSLMFTD